MRWLNVPAAGSGGRLRLTLPVKPELTAALTVMNDRLAQGASESTCSLAIRIPVGVTKTMAAVETVSVHFFLENLLN